MLVPIVPNSTIINKTIVYSDTVLPLKESGNNLKVCIISDVDEYSLENCLKKVFESNPDVIFNTIQYSKNNKKVYFYTNKIISTKAWKESKVIKYQHLSNSKEVLEEVSNILKLEKNSDSNIISLYDVAVLLRKVEKTYKNLIKEYEYECQRKLKSYFYEPSVIISDFKNNQLKIGFRRLIGNDHDYLIFSKKDGDLYVLESETLYTDEILTSIGNELSNLYDELLKYDGFINQYSYGIKPISSNFSVDISQYGVNIFSNEFKLSCHSYTNDYDYECNSTSVLAVLQGKEDEIFKRIFVNINDCPLWSRETLYQIRQEQLKMPSKESIKSKILKLFKR